MAESLYKEAVSLIIVSRTLDTDGVTKIYESFTEEGAPKVGTVNSSSDHNRDFKILLVKRNPCSRHLPNFSVFPGGGVTPADFSPCWWTVFAKCGISRSRLLNSFQNVKNATRPPIISSPLAIRTLMCDDPIPSDVALRITCIRETFEETGILLLTNGQLEVISLDAIDVVHWQKKVHEDSEQFLELYLSLSACPNVWLLYEWSNWMTPPSFGLRRFDTMFYVCCLSSPPDVSLDHEEMTDMKWFSNEELHSEKSLSKLLLAPPQVYEMSRLFSLPSYLEVKKFVKRRQLEGCSRWIPFVVFVADGMLHLLPGDDLYVDDDRKEAMLKFFSTQSIENLRLQSKRLNRIEILYPNIVAKCNVGLSFEHSQNAAGQKSHL